MILVFEFSFPFKLCSLLRKFSLICLLAFPFPYTFMVCPDLCLSPSHSGLLQSHSQAPGPEFTSFPIVNSLVPWFCFLPKILILWFLSLSWPGVSGCLNYFSNKSFTTLWCCICNRRIPRQVTSFLWLQKILHDLIFHWVSGLSDLWHT